MRVLLVGATHPCHNPRLVREADTLAEAGHQVRVVAPSWVPELAEKDRRLLRGRRWRLETVDFVPESRVGKARSRLILGRRRLARILANRLASPPPLLAAHAYTHAYPEMRRLASREPADWVVAHAQGALPVAAAAAARWSARLGFDCEDMLSLCENDPPHLVRSLERRHLPACAYISAASAEMAGQLVAAYQVPRPTVLYNVFPRSLAAGVTPPERRPRRSPGTPLRLHWVGQTIGTGRGLEDVIQALARVGGGVELYLRGSIGEAFRRSLDQLTARLGVQQHIHLLPTVDHDEVVRAMDGMDVGLVLERPEHANAAHTVTNKFFSYLLGGLAVLGTDTPGQREAAALASGIAVLYPANDLHALASRLAYWRDHPDELRAAQQSGWSAAQERLCWDEESRTFLRLLEQPSQGHAG